MYWTTVCLSSYHLLVISVHQGWAGNVFQEPTALNVESSCGRQGQGSWLPRGWRMQWNSDDRHKNWQAKARRAGGGGGEDKGRMVCMWQEGGLPKLTWQCFDRNGASMQLQPLQKQKSRGQKRALDESGRGQARLLHAFFFLIHSPILSLSPTPTPTVDSIVGVDHAHCEVFVKIVVAIFF